jgi:hypothetical protein
MKSATSTYTKTRFSLEAYGKVVNRTFLSKLFKNATKDQDIIFDV